MSPHRTSHGQRFKAWHDLCQRETFNDRGCRGLQGFVGAVNEMEIDSEYDDRTRLIHPYSGLIPICALLLKIGARIRPIIDFARYGCYPIAHSRNNYL